MTGKVATTTGTENARRRLTKRKLDWTIQEGIEAPVNWRFESILITPEEAQSILDEFNTSNRAISKTSVNKYVTDIQNGNWDPFNGEFIIRSVDGQLLNGQNRLKAIVEAGIPQVMTVMWGVDPVSRYKMDIGRNRSDAHILQIEGTPDPGTKAAVSRLILQLETWQENENITDFPQTSQYIPTGDAAERVMSDPQVMAAVEFANDRDNRIPAMSKGVVGGLYYALAKYGDPDAAQEFMTQLRDGNGKYSSPVMGFRRRLLSAVASTTPQSRFTTRGAMLKLAIHSYNTWREGGVWERARTPKAFPRITSK